MTKNMLFETPVAVVVGLGLRHDIGSLAEMHRFLMEWTTSRRGPLHAVALETCEAVRMGELSVGYARNAFVDFAEASHILWEEDMDPAAAIGAGSEVAEKPALVPHPLHALPLQFAPHAPSTESHRGRASNM
jgi:hypothetical protein